MGRIRADTVGFECDTCGKGVVRRLSKVWKSKHTYCSWECSRGLQGTRKRPHEWLYTRLVRSARERSKEVDLTYREFAGFTNLNKCHYCAANITWPAHASTRSIYNSSAYNLDRKDHRIGYTYTNLVPCCICCNKSKGDRFSYAEWLAIGKLINEMRGNG